MPWMMEAKEQGGGHAFAGDVGHDGDEAVGHGYDVVEVAAYAGAGDGLCHEAGVGEGGEVAGDDALLDGGGDGEFVAHEVGGALGLNHAGMFDEVGGFRRDGVQDIAADAVEGAGAEAAVEIEEAEEAVGVSAAERDGDDAHEIVEDHALAVGGEAVVRGVADVVADEVLLAGGGGIADDGAGDLRVVDEGNACFVEAALEVEGGGAVAEEDEAAFGSGEAEGVFDHGAEYVVEDAGVVEALRGLKEEGELFELGGGVVDGDAVEEAAGGGLVLLREGELERDAGVSELDAVAGIEPREGGAYSVDEDALAAAEILDEVAFGVAVDGCVLAGDLRVGEAEVTVGLSADGEGERANGDGSCLVAFADD